MKAEGEEAYGRRAGVSRPVATNAYKLCRWCGVATGFRGYQVK
jgi:hypothetical protein